jgi:hypothetical protein
VAPPQLKEGPQDDDDNDDDDDDNNNNTSHDAVQQHMRIRKFAAIRHRPTAEGYTTFSPNLEATSIKIEVLEG